MLSRHFLAVTWKPMKNCQDRRCPGKDSKWTPSENKSELLPFEPTCSADEYRPSLSRVNLLSDTFISIRSKFHLFSCNEWGNIEPRGTNKKNLLRIAGEDAFRKSKSVESSSIKKAEHLGEGGGTSPLCLILFTLRKERTTKQNALNLICHLPSV